jgi:predicted transcriptional regulator
MSQPKPKERALQAIRDLPDDASVEDVMERLYFLSKVEEGIRQADAGQTMSHEEVKRRLHG